MWMGRNVMSNASWNYIYVNFEYASRISSFFFFLFPFRSIVFETSFRCLSPIHLDWNATISFRFIFLPMLWMNRNVL